MSKRESEDLVYISDVYCKQATDKAILVDIEGDEYWIPQSQVHADSEVYKEGDRGELVISRWIAEQKGLE